MIVWLKRIISKLIKYKKPIQFGSRGQNVIIGLKCEFSYPENIYLGSNIKIGDYTGLYAQGGLYIEDGTILADRVDIRTANHYYDGDNLNLLPFDEKVIVAPVHIKENCWISSHVIILSGVTIGEGSVIGAGAVVTKDIPPLSIAVGNPARVIKFRNKDKYFELKSNEHIYMKEFDYLNRKLINKKDIIL